MVPRIPECAWAEAEPVGWSVALAHQVHHELFAAHLHRVDAVRVSVVLQTLASPCAALLPVPPDILWAVLLLVLHPHLLHRVRPEMSST